MARPVADLKGVKGKVVKKPGCPHVDKGRSENRATGNPSPHGTPVSFLGTIPPAPAPATLADLNDTATPAQRPRQWKPRPRRWPPDWFTRATSADLTNPSRKGMKPIHPLCRRPPATPPESLPRTAFPSRRIDDHHQTQATLAGISCRASCALLGAFLQQGPATVSKATHCVGDDTPASCTNEIHEIQ